MNRINLTNGELAALAARIQRDYDYDDRSGRLINAKNNRVVKGHKGAYRNGKGRYLYMAFHVNGRLYQLRMHRAVWAWHNGCFPTMQIDHIDHDPMNNRIENLREVTASENLMNRLHPWKPNANTGLPGVCKNRGVYQIKVAQHRYYFRDPFVAFYHLTLLGRRFK